MATYLVHRPPKKAFLGFLSTPPPSFICFFMEKVIKHILESLSTIKSEIKEAKRQIALLFGLLKTYQPVDDITKLLAAIDNASIRKVKINNHGSGYAPGYGVPAVCLRS